MGIAVGRRLAAMALAIALGAPGASAGPTWDALKRDVYGDRPILDGRGIVELHAPTRPLDQRAVPVAVKAHLADGRTIRSVTVVVDENPSPVAAVFTLGAGRGSVELAGKFRFNEATDVRAVVEASDGALYMVERHVKFAGGQASCSAPPQGDPAEIAASMGRMSLAHVETTHTPATAAATKLTPKARLTLSHPNHTGMVLDQLTLHYIPLRMVTDIEVRQGADLVYTMAGSITLSQNPEIEFDYRLNGEPAMSVTARDSDGASWTQTFPLGQGS
jgi:sulfur-oxidizing protein SoxY